MEWSFLFFFNSALLGVGLAMDAFSVSMANGLHDPRMSRRRGVQIAGTFAVFQAAMPMLGWVCVHTIVELFSSFETLIPWIALILLGYIGGKMLLEGIKGEETEEAAELSAGALFMQGVATSIDALSVGFTISEYGWLMALVCSLIVAIVTFFICEAGLAIGKKFGTKLSGKASVLEDLENPSQIAKILQDTISQTKQNVPFTDNAKVTFVKCKYCGCKNKSTDTVCSSCGAPLE